MAESSPLVGLDTDGVVCDDIPVTESRYNLRSHRQLTERAMASGDLPGVTHRSVYVRDPVENMTNGYGSVA